MKIEVEATVRITAGWLKGQKGEVESTDGRFAVVQVNGARVELSLGVLELAR